MFKKIVCIRGATTSKNTEEEIIKNVCELCNQIFILNKIKTKDLISIQFSITEEITVLNPATALRKGNSVIDVTKAALFCTQEAKIQGSLQNCIRVMIQTYTHSSKKNNIYLNDATKLRPDYIKGQK